MKVLIIGSRNITDYPLLEKVIKESGFIISLIVSGGARGVDKLAERYAKENRIPIKIYTADWNLGKSAGFIRNSVLYKESDALIALWNGESAGTKHMINLMKNKPSHIYIKKD